MAEGAGARTWGERRRAQTRAALIRAAQQLIAEERTAVPVLTISQLADVGMGSFYNHFASKDELFQEAVDDALELHGRVLDAWTQDFPDPADAFARSFRLTGRLHRMEPQLSRVLLSRGPAMVTSERGLAPRALRDIERAAAAGRFDVADPDSALLITGGAAMTLGHLLRENPDRDDAALTDQVTRDLLRAFGVPVRDAAEICARELPDVRRLLDEAASAGQA